MVPAGFRVLIVGLLATALVAGPAQACTSTSGPFQSVRFVATDDGATIVDLPTTIQVGPNGLCGYSGPPPLSFDGRFASWLQDGRSLHVVDLEDGQESVYPRGIHTRGHLALLPEDGLRLNVTLVDLANGTSQQVQAPPEESFVANVAGAVVARAMNATWAPPPTSVSVLDPVTGQWLLRGHKVDVASPNVAAGSRDWVVFGSEGTISVLDVATGEVSDLLTEGTAYGVLGNRLYLQSATTWTSRGSSGSREGWSVTLPAGGDRMAGYLPEQTTVGSRHVAFVVQGSSTGTGSADSTPPSTVPPSTDDAPQAPATRAATATDADSPFGDVLDVPSPLAWASLAAIVVAAWAVRRRLD